MCLEKIQNKEASKFFQKIRSAQGEVALPKLKYKEAVKATRSGKIKAIDNKKIIQICSSAGTPLDNLAGVKIYKYIGNTVKKDDIMFEIFSSNQNRLQSAVKMTEKIKPYVY